MTGRHLTPEERQTLLHLTEACGIPEVLRTLGAIVANEHPDLETGSLYRSELFTVAREFAEDIEVFPSRERTDP